MNYPRVGTQQVNFADVYNMEKEAQANNPLRQLIGAGGEIGSTYLAYKKEQQKKADVDQLLKDYREGTGTFAPTLTEEQKVNAPLNIDITERMIGAKMPTLLGISSVVPRNTEDVGIDGGTGSVLDVQGNEITLGSTEADPTVSRLNTELDIGNRDIASLDKNLMGLRPLMNPNAPQIPTTPQPSELTDAQKDQILFKKLYDIDPARAKFELDRIQQEKQLKASEQKKTGIYTAEQKQLIDAKNENRLQMQKAQASMNTASAKKDEENYNYWKTQVDAYKSNDVELNNALASTGLSGYKKIEATDGTTDGKSDVDTNGSSTTNTDESNYAKAEKIVTDALAVDGQGYTTTAKKKIATTKLLQFNATLGAFPLKQNEIDALELFIKSASIPTVVDTAKEAQKAFQDIKNVAPTVVTDYGTVKAMYNAFSSALSNASSNPEQSYYMLLKKQLGDAIGTTDFAGLSGNDVWSGLVAKAKNFLNASPVDETKAKAEVIGFINSLNSAINAHNKKINDVITSSKITNTDGINLFKTNYALDKLATPSKTEQHENKTTPKPKESPRVGYEWVWKPSKNRWGQTPIRK